MRTRSTLLAATLALGLGFPTAGYSIYFWRDADGRPNYTDVCPTGVVCVPLGPGGAFKAYGASSAAPTQPSMGQGSTSGGGSGTSVFNRSTSTPPPGAPSTTAAAPSAPSGSSGTSTSSTTSPMTTTPPPTTTTPPPTTTTTPPPPTTLPPLTPPTGPVLAQEVAKDADLRNHPDVLWYPGFNDLATSKADWWWNPVLYDGTGWPKVEFIDVPEFGTRAARFESRSLNPYTKLGSDGSTIMNWRKWLNENTKEASSAKALGNVPLNDLYLRYCVLLEQDILTGINESGVKLGGFSARADGQGAPVTMIFWHAKPDALGRFRLTSTYWIAETFIDPTTHYGADWIKDKYLMPNTWHCLEEHLRLNTMNSNGTPNADAVFEAWLDDELIFSKNGFVIHHYTGPLPIEINNVHAQIFHGGMATPLTPIHYRVTGFVLAKRHIGAPKRLN